VLLLCLVLHCYVLYSRLQPRNVVTNCGTLIRSDWRQKLQCWERHIVLWCIRFSSAAHIIYKMWGFHASVCLYCGLLVWNIVLSLAWIKVLEGICQRVYYAVCICNSTAFTPWKFRPWRCSQNVDAVYTLFNRRLRLGYLLIIAACLLIVQSPRCLRHLKFIGSSVAFDI